MPSKCSLPGFPCDTPGTQSEQGEQLGEVDVLAAIAGLVDRSLVRHGEELEGKARFGMLESIREYGWRLLIDGGEAPEPGAIVYVQGADGNTLKVSTRRAG